MKYPIVVLALVLALVLAVTVVVYAANNVANSQYEETEAGKEIEIAALKSGAVVTADWNNESVRFDAALNNVNVAVDEVRVYIENDGGLTNIVCQDISGWNVFQIGDYPDRQIGSSHMCWFFTQGELSVGDTFSFEAGLEKDVLEKKQPINLKFEVREKNSEEGRIVSFVHEFNWGVN